MNSQEIKMVLVEKHGYSEKEAEDIVKRFDQMSQELKLAFQAYLKEGKISDLSREGYSWEKLRTDYGMTPIGAFLILAWLEEEPEKAKEALSKGYDEILFKGKVRK